MNEGNETLQLYVPRPEDGWFYMRMMSDPATMAYNAPWFPPDGCIPNAAEEWNDLCADWIGHEPTRFYAYLERVSDGAFVGDVNYHLNAQGTQYDMGIVIYAPERGKGYGTAGLRLLADKALRIDGVPALHNDFETDRDAAYAIHKAVGFRDVGEGDGMVHVALTREDYLKMEEKMVELRPITEDNFLDAFGLTLAPGQETFVSHPIRSLAQAYVYRNQCQPFGIYARGRMVGYVMVIYDYDVPEYDIWHMMIDAGEQGRGYGGEALDRVLAYIRTKPFGDSSRVALTCNKDNPVARKLYESRGFSPTGNGDGDEIELAMTVR